MRKAITNWEGYSEEDFPDKVNTSNTSLTTHAADFPDLPVAVATQVTLRGAYETIRLAPYYNEQAAELKAKRKVIQTNITKNGNYINEVANGDVVLLEKSGYPLSKAPSQQGVLPATTLKLSVRDTPGELNYDISGVVTSGIKFAIFYTLRSNPETNPFKWAFLYSPKRKGILRGLLSGETYKMVSVAMGTEQELTFSEEVNKKAL